MTTTALILTHRKGAAIAFFKTGLPIPALWTAETLQLCFSHHAQKQEEIQFQIQHPDIKLFRALGKTAESLSNLWQFGLLHSGISLAQVNDLIVGIGPGSFTGLRLGCAFANGLKLGLPHLNLHEVISYFPQDILDTLPEEKFKQDAITQFENMTPMEHALISFYDLLWCFQNYQQQQNNSPVDSCIPRYGKEPTPVLALKGVLYGNQS